MKSRRKYQSHTGGENSGTGRTPIDRFAIDYDVPVELANILVGRTESETDNRITQFVKYLRSVIVKYNDPAIAWEERFQQEV
jgi:hypothetical protein